MNVADEHVLLRRFLRQLGSSYEYQEPTLPAGRWDHSPVRLGPVRPASAPAAPPANRPSALAFALSGQAEAEPAASVALAPAGPPALGAAPAVISKPTYHRIFSYYGGKSKIAQLYTPPRHDVVIEPFAGSAGYSALHYERQVCLNDKDEITFVVWKFLLREDAAEYVEKWFPANVKEGTKIDAILPIDIDRGFITFLRAEIAQGSLGCESVRTIVTPWGARDWHQVRDRIDYWIPRIKHWTVTNLDYTDLPNREATWYVDPPYNNAAGSIYRTHGLNYGRLAKWCMSREGQTIVCENEGARWLPFRFLTKRMGSFTGRDDVANAGGNEVVWESGVDPTIEVQETNALEFALGGSAPEPPAAPSPPPPRATLTEFLAAVPAAVSLSHAHALAISLQSRGYELLTRNGKLFVKHAPDIPDVSDEDRAAIQALKPELIALATPWPEERPTSLAVFLGSAPPPRRESTWVQQEPPDLTNIRDIILNFETNGLDWANGNEPIGVTIGTLDGQISRYLPFAHNGGGNLDRDTIIRYLQREVRGKHITNANTRFDVHMGRNIGVDFEVQDCTVSDVQHYAALLDDHRKKFKLDVLAQDYLGGIQVERVDERVMADYHASEVGTRAEYQAMLVAQLREKMWPLLDEQDLQRVRQLEDDVIYPICEMEHNGSLLNVPLLHQYHAECTKQHDDLMMEIIREVGFAFEHNASGWKKLLEHLSLEIPDSFAEGVLNQYDHPLVKKAQRASQLAQLDSKTFAAYLKQINSDGLLRYDINQLRGDEGGTVSGRLSSGNQQTPNHDNHFAAFGEELFPRRLFIAAEGMDYLESDARQVEYRLFAHFAQNPTVLQAYRDDPLMSFHKKTWEMFKTYKPDMLYSHQKNLNFAKMYAARLVKLAVMMGFITEREAQEIRSKKAWNDPRLNETREIEGIYNRVMPEVDRLLDEASHLAKSSCDDYCRRGDALHRKYPHRGFVKTILGRRSRFPDNWKTYVALNRVLQGSAADIMKRKLVELHRARKYTGFLMRSTLHDAVGGDARLPETLSRVQEVLDAQSFPLRVMILWSCGVGKSWADCK